MRRAAIPMRERRLFVGNHFQSEFPDMRNLSRSFQSESPRFVDGQGTGTIDELFVRLALPVVVLKSSSKIEFGEDV